MRTSIFKYRVLSLSLSLSLNGRPFSLSFSLFVPRYPFELWNHYIVWTTDAETCSHRTSYRNILKGTLVQTREKLQMLTFKQGNLAIHQRSTMKGQRPLHIFRFVVHPSSKFEERSRWRLNQLNRSREARFRFSESGFILIKDRDRDRSWKKSLAESSHPTTGHTRNANGFGAKGRNKRVKCQRDYILLLPMKEQTYPISDLEIVLFARVPLKERNLIHRNDVGLWIACQTDGDKSNRSRENNRKRIRERTCLSRVIHRERSMYILRDMYNVVCSFCFNVRFFYPNLKNVL